MSCPQAGCHAWREGGWVAVVHVAARRASTSDRARARGSARSPCREVFMLRKETLSGGRHCPCDGRDPRGYVIEVVQNQSHDFNALSNSALVQLTKAVLGFFV